MIALRNNRTRTLVECAMMVALSAVLQLITFVPMANGGSVTLASMAPIVFIALRRGPKWGLLSAFAESLVQMLMGGISAPPVKTFFWFAVVVLLDYVIAFTALGLAPLFARPFKNPLVGAGAGSVCVTLLRYACHFLSGMLVWYEYCPEGQPLWLYSLAYNGTYMIPETIITAVAVVLLCAVFEKTDAQKTVHA